MIFNIRLTDQAIEDLERLNRNVAKQIINKLEHYLVHDDPLRFSKPLRGDLRGLFRFRIGNYRAIFRKEPSGAFTILFIITIKHRKEVYD